MSNTVIKVEGLYKQYRLGTVGTGTLSHDLNRIWHKMRGKEDPYLKLGETNDRTTKGAGQYVWALDDINFEVKQGEILGILGRNGAGKSTLLKILSKVTTPTKGNIHIKGRIASLLEVGTGFHPELTGRENIFLNGAILGMNKNEIRSKFDEIVDFSGVERYIDTPVKRYSSGMYVRLAFAVAAHLEPEILIVDEVLAVGDAEFQKKCLGKIKSVKDKEGKTVLLVSHNLNSIQSLATSCVLLKNGQLVSAGSTDAIVEQYILQGRSNSEKSLSTREDRQGTGKAKFSNVRFVVNDDIETNSLVSGENIKIVITVVNTSNAEMKNCSIGIGFFSNNGSMLTAFKSDGLLTYYNLRPGDNEIVCSIPRFPLTNGQYYYNLIVNDMIETHDWVAEAGNFNVENGDFFGTGKIPANSQQIILINHSWS